MSPILRREHEYEYDPRKRRAALHEFARQREEYDEPPISGEDGEMRLEEEDAALRKVTRHRSYGSDQGSLESVGVEEEDPGESDGVVPARPLLKRTIVHLALTLAIQSTPSLLLSLVGLVFTGQLLDHLAVWSVFRRVDELFILVPVLGNLKGNLEMCLGARLGTSVRPSSLPLTFADPSQANRGHLDTASHRRAIITHALTYLLLQALIISSIAGVLSFSLGLTLNHRIADPTSPEEPGTEGPHREGYTPPGLQEFTLVVGTGMVAACLSSLVLGSFMSWLVVACRWLGVDPDNIASPLAATLGDLLTLFIMALVGAMLVKTIDTSVPFVVVLLMCGLTAGIWFALRMMARRRGKQDLEEESEEGGWSPLVSIWIPRVERGANRSRSAP